jgi:hypothetical protein
MSTRWRGPPSWSSPQMNPEPPTIVVTKIRGMTVSKDGAIGLTILLRISRDGSRFLAGWLCSLGFTKAINLAER